ncbi:hypothetical protein [Falsirhodobacter sp. alg1]|uniref:hypothetical protein n=1 Tax=Falsirhodobacter sp. alg1 TaxID=1472418 RepID=UPI0005EF8997|nr:hypothetical protein [Falsirhodobacter sp. alg1]
MIISNPWTVWRPLAAALLLGLVLWIPAAPALPAAFLSLELPVILVIAAFPMLRGPVLAALAGLVILKGLEAGMLAAFHRPFDLLSDWPLVRAAWQTAGGAIGALRLTIGLVAGAGALVLLGFAARWSLCQQRIWIPGVTLAMLAPFVPHQAQNTTFVLRKAAEFRTALADRAIFQAESAADPFDGAATVLAGLGNHDAAILFVESYGRTSFDNPRYAAHIDLLRGAEADLRQAGLSMRSGWLTSPVSGGQSWLAHGTLASGLWINSQSRYGALLDSPRRTLFHLGQQSGRHTLSVAPAITLEWPEGPKLGFDEILDAETLAYRGQPLNWVTMPDQYTLSVLERRMRAPHDAPLLAEVSLVSSHAPWVPVIGMIPWDDVGDGSVFDGQGWDDRSPEQIWADPDTIRSQYAAAIAYSLRAVMGFAKRQAGNPPLLVVLGDHQPANFVAEMDNRDVPVHIIGPAGLVDRIAGWSWTDGLIPDETVAAWPMDLFRDRFLTAFGG